MGQDFKILFLRSIYENNMKSRGCVPKWPGSLTIFDCGCEENYIDVAEGVVVEASLRKQHES